MDLENCFPRSRGILFLRKTGTMQEKNRQESTPVNFSGRRIDYGGESDGIYSSG
jgi:hypothetical protein